MNTRTIRQILHVVAGAALMATMPLGGVAQSSARSGGDSAAKARSESGDVRSLRGLRSVRALRGTESLASLSSLGSLGSLESLGSLGSLVSIGSLESLRSLEKIDHLADLGELERLTDLPLRVSAHALSSLASSASLASLGALGSFGYGDAQSYRGEERLDQTTDSMYREAREVMNRGDYKRAADLFRQVARRSPRSPVAGDALYWQAYSLYRSGGSSELSTALSSLTRLEREYPAASAAGDAGTLRIRICGELAKRGDENCAAQVTSAARTGSGERRELPERAARAERGERTSRGEQSMQGCPRDDDDDERVAALNALLQMDSDKALPILERVLARRDRCSAALRRKAVFLVSQKGDARAADILMGAVKNDPDEEVREQAVFWLGQTKDPRAVDMLQQILKTETNDDVLSKAVFALSQHSSERANSIVRDLAQRDGAPLQVREQAIFWLGQQRSGDNGAVLRDLYGKVREEQLKEKIIFAISQNQGRGNDRFLLDVALDDKEPMEMRKKALFWAGQSRSTSLDDLSSLYNKISDREIKEQIIFVYSQRRESSAVDKLMDIAKNEKDRELRKKAVFWLSQSRDPRVPKFLEDIIG